MADAPAGADTPADTPIVPLLWFTDRTRFKTGTSRCARARYLGYHFGPSGYGITSYSEAMPLATGRYVASGIEGFLAVLAATGELPDLTATRQTIALVQAEYEAQIAARGFRSQRASDTTDFLAKEQSTLIAGLLWTIRLQFLPWFHTQYELVEHEREHLVLLDCTCGAPAIDHEAEHYRRGCDGIAYMQRVDIIARHRQSQNLAYFEVKTTGWESSAWAEQWETDYQLGLGTLGMRERYGAEVTELFIVGLNKGSRKREKDELGIESGPKRQQSALCYGYCRPGNPPLAPDDWLPSYRYVDETGKSRQVSRQHRKRPIWELKDSDWPVLAAYREREPEATVEELWFRLLPESIAEKVCFVLGPMNRQDAQLESVIRAMRAEETRWQERVWRLYERQMVGATFADPTFQQGLDELIPQSWACRPFGKEHECDFVPICHRYAGWQDPLRMTDEDGKPRYRLRLPHHAPELQQAVARGLLVAEAAEAEERE